MKNIISHIRIITLLENYFTLFLIRDLQQIRINDNNL